MMKSTYYPVTILALACSWIGQVDAFVPVSLTTPSGLSASSSSTCLHYRNEGGDYDYSQGNLRYGTSKYTQRNGGYDGFSGDPANMAPMGRSMQYNVQRDSDRVREFERLRHYGQYDDEFSPDYLGPMDDRMHRNDYEAERFVGRLSPRDRYMGLRGEESFNDFSEQYDRPFLPGRRTSPRGGYRETDRDSDPIIGRTTRAGPDGRGFNPTNPINRRSPQHLFGRRQDGRDYYREDEPPMGRGYDPRELRSRFGSRRGPQEGGGNGGLLRDHFKYN